MLRSRKSNLLLRTIAPLLLLAMQSGLWAFIWIRFYADIVPDPFYWKGQLLLVSLYFILLSAISNFYSGFRIGFFRATEVALSNMIALVLTNIITYLQACLIIVSIVTPFPILAMTAIQCIIAVFWAFITNRIYTRSSKPHRMLMLYDGTKPVDALINKLHTRPDKYKIEDTLCVAETDFDTVCARISDFDAVILRGLSSDLCHHIQRFCFEHSIRSYIVPDIEALLIHGAEEINLFDTPLLLNRNDEQKNDQRMVKRIFDIVFSVSALIVLLPFSLITALAIKIEDGGPVFYSQERLTVGGKSFMLYKFRSMKVNAEKAGAQLSPQNDDRITAVGRVIRSIRLDEIPQFFNVLKGDMSIVGPRPERPEIAEEYQKTMPEFVYRLKVKAGLTGYAQVYGNYNTDPWDKLLMDMIYISNFSLMMDLKIVLMTFKILLQRRRTEGVALDHRQWRNKGE